MLPIRDTQGGIRAQINYAVMVRNSSPNLQNAYEFIKFLLSEEFQLDTMDWRWQDFSVLNATNERYYIANTGRAATIRTFPPTTPMALPATSCCRSRTTTSCCPT